MDFVLQEGYIGKFRDITGQKFGRLTAIRLEYRKNNKQYWLCKCTCRKEKIIDKSHLMGGRIKSCGCIKTEMLKNNPHSKTHGMKNTKFYGKWIMMKRRCRDKKCQVYKNYGGRGISVCDRWLKFENFRDDMYQFYLEHVKEFGEKDTTIDRINNDGNYCKENCRWATLIEQGNNKTNSRYLIYNGEKLTITQWADIVGISEDVIRFRLDKYGWNIKDALTIPLYDSLRGGNSTSFKKGMIPWNKKNK